MDDLGHMPPLVKLSAFFCSNATMPSAWSLYKILLVVLISAEEADTEVGASRASYDKMSKMMSCA